MTPKQEAKASELLKDIRHFLNDSSRQLRAIRSHIDETEEHVAHLSRTLDGAADSMEAIARDLEISW